ncbi:sigma-70 family RNA polymerase sigma factor [uncultured Bacteroides sp.]|jgi:RNA polymerase sigma factor (sigma-70 family)|uniref:RNA polymerase sigma factor n=1 Tax=uncultured Bacteroides sp. TaxID=162156 RepID=UPI0025963538|nr:sigma-70 family RNA polymerase sigma factor [uncultured Bacteroides sp.]
MEENFEYIVRKYYNRQREPFLRKLTRQYPSMRLDIAEDLYQEAFIAVQDNIQRGKVRPDTDWNAYILTIGLNMASKEQRHGGITDPFDAMYDDDKEDGNNRLARKVEDIIKEMPEEEAALCNNPEVLSRLGNELEHTPEPCGNIIRLFYYTDATMEDIAEETGLKNAQTAKAKKSQCMTDLINRVTEALRRAGFDVTPKKRNRNGKN